jgi:hypothetical protein
MVGFCVVGQSPMEFEAIPNDALPNSGSSTGRSRESEERLGNSKDLDQHGRNRGLRFTPEMLRYCGRKYRVLSRLERRISEIDGQLLEFGNSCVLLENVICKGQRTFCARSEYHYWREIWLDRC